MTLADKWRIVEMPDYEADYPDMLEPAYILFDRRGSGEFAFGCITGHIWGAEVLGCRRVLLGRQPGQGEATDGPNSSPTALSTAKSASIAAMKPASPPSLGPLLQQPVRPLRQLRARKMPAHGDGWYACCVTFITGRSGKV